MYVRRKVFSYSEPEEQLYSVDMTETEYVLFSAYMNGFDDAVEALYADTDDIAAASAAGIGAATALGAAGYGVNAALKDEGGIKKVLKNRSAAIKDAEKIAKRQTEQIERQGNQFVKSKLKGLKGKAREEAARKAEESAREIKNIKMEGVKAGLKTRTGAANSATKEAFKRGFEGLKKNKKALAIGGAGLAATGIAGGYAAGYNRK